MSGSPAQRIVRQWLQTDAAFGVEDAPISAVRHGKELHFGMGENAEPDEVPAARPVAAPRPAVAAAPRPAPPRAVGAPAPKAPALIPGVTSDSAMAKKPKMAMPAAPAGNVHDLPPITRRQKEEALEALRKELEAAAKPFLSDVATRVVFGEGDPDAKLLFIGEGPGVEEDRVGRPFVGRSGQLLDKMIGALNFRRDATGGIFIANVVKLRSADWDAEHTKLTDRAPTPEEAARGMPYLHRQIEIIRPKVIVTLGAPAIKHLTGTTQGVMSIRGTWFSYRGIPVMPTYHPAFVLRAYTEENRRKVWSDLQAAQKKIGE